MGKSKVVSSRRKTSKPTIGKNDPGPSLVIRRLTKAQIKAAKAAEKEDDKGDSDVEIVYDESSIDSDDDDDYHVSSSSSKKPKDRTKVRSLRRRAAINYTVDKEDDLQEKYVEKEDKKPRKKRILQTDSDDHHQVDDEDDGPQEKSVQKPRKKTTFQTDNDDDDEKEKTEDGSDAYSPEDDEDDDSDSDDLDRKPKKVSPKGKASDWDKAEHNLRMTVLRKKKKLYGLQIDYWEQKLRNLDSSQEKKHYH